MASRKLNSDLLLSSQQIHNILTSRQLLWICCVVIPVTKQILNKSNKKSLSVPAQYTQPTAIGAIAECPQLGRILFGQTLRVSLSYGVSF